MKKLLPLILLVIASFSSWAGTVFDEDFESEIYQPGEAIPTGWGVTKYGSWLELLPPIRIGQVVMENGNQYVELRPTAQDTRGARIRAIFGKDNQAATPILGGLEILLAVKFSGQPDETFYLQVLGGDGRSRANLEMAEDLRLRASFAGKRESFGPPLTPGQWYRLRLLLPAKPENSSLWTVELYDEDGATLLDSKQGRISRRLEEGGESYTSLDIQHNTPGVSLFIDDLKVTENLGQD